MRPLNDVQWQVLKRLRAGERLTRRVVRYFNGKEHSGYWLGTWPVHSATLNVLLRRGLIEGDGDVYRAKRT